MRIKFTILVTFLLAAMLTVTKGQTVSTFESLTLNTNSFWNGSSQPLGTSFEDGNASFVNQYDTAWGGMWSSGWAYSNVTDSTTAGYLNMYAARTGGGYDGSSNYAVGQVDSYNQVNPKIKLSPAARGKMVSGAYFTNGTYSAISMRDGDTYAKKFGGVTGNDPDWFKIVVRKWFGGVLANDSVEIFLADFRSDNNDEDYILTQWQWVDLTSLGNVDSLTFSMSSSDVSIAGINTPLFFCMDNFSTTEQCVGIAKSTKNPLVCTFPNPVQNQLTIDTQINDEKSINIFDQTGRLIFATRTHEMITTLDLSTFSKGVYLLKIEGNHINYSQKIMKQ